jgi:hypothetical protein
MPIQDDGHVHQITLAKAGYGTCFPGCDIKVDVGYDDGVFDVSDSKEENFPTKVTVTRSYNGRVTSVESYEKQFEFGASGQKTYNALVSCKRHVFRGGRAGTVVYAKVQTFDGEREWERLEGGLADPERNTANTALNSVSRRRRRATSA